LIGGDGTMDDGSGFVSRLGTIESVIQLDRRVRGSCTQLAKREDVPSGSRLRG
jgi:hypothetical protein